MKNIYMPVIPFIIAVAISSCKCPEITTAATAGNDTVAIESKENNSSQDEIINAPSHRLVVSFISIGEGTSPKAKGLMDDYIAGFESSHGKDIIYASKPWGREGESDHYFLLKELNEEEQKEFVMGMKKVFEGNSLIIIEEDRPNKSSK